MVQLAQTYGTVTVCSGVIDSCLYFKHRPYQGGCYGCRVLLEEYQMVAPIRLFVRRYGSSGGDDCRCFRLFARLAGLQLPA
jgi:hypothetical protein